MKKVGKGQMKRPPEVQWTVSLYWEPFKKNKWFTVYERDGVWFLMLPLEFKC